MRQLLLAATLAFGAAALFPAGEASATANQRTAQKVWTESDKCSKQAFERFPDYTPEDSAKRDAFTRRCLNARNLPGRSAAPSKQ